MPDAAGDRERLAVHRAGLLPLFAAHLNRLVTHRHHDVQLIVRGHPVTPLDVGLIHDHPRDPPHAAGDLDDVSVGRLRMLQQRSQRQGLGLAGQFSRVGLPYRAEQRIEALALVRPHGQPIARTHVVPEPDVHAQAAQQDLRRADAQAGILTLGEPGDARRDKHQRRPAVTLLAHLDEHRGAARGLVELRSLAPRGGDVAREHDGRALGVVQLHVELVVAFEVEQRRQARAQRKLRHFAHTSAQRKKLGPRTVWIGAHGNPRHVVTLPAVDFIPADLRHAVEYLDQRLWVAGLDRLPIAERTPITLTDVEQLQQLTGRRQGRGQNARRTLGRPRHRGRLLASVETVSSRPHRQVPTRRQTHARRTHNQCRIMESATPPNQNIRNHAEH